MHDPDQHVSPIKNWKQLVVVVVLAFAVPITLGILASQWVTSGSRGMHEDDAAILARIQPVGQVQLAGASGPKGQLTGEQVYGQVCKNCHEAGLMNAPKFRDQGAWAKVIAQGQAVATDHAIKGIRAMPPKGGNPDLDDVEVERAVAFMASNAGAAWKEPPVARPATVTATGERTGEEVVRIICSKCHATGEGGAPKIGDRIAWRDRAKRGYKSVLQSALRGHAGMPARGGMAELSDKEVGNAVEYMMNSGAEQPVLAAAPAATAPAPAAAAPPAAAPTAAGAKPDGKKVFDTTCHVCHGTGVAGAPKFGDKAAWAPRLAQGIDTLVKTALTGKGAMPPKGGNNALSDAEVRAAVEYMAAAAK
jgi:cytochrome c5